MKEDAKQEFAEANRLWDGGRKAEAVAKYEPILKADRFGVPPDSEKPTTYQRVIDFEVEKGNTAVAKEFIEKALEKKVDIPSSNKATTELIVQVRADREKREAEELARREAEAKWKRDEEAAEAKRRQDERANAPRLSVEVVKVRLEPFRTATGSDTKMVYVDWKNTGNRPVRAVSAKLKVYDDAGNEIASYPSYPVYASSNDSSGVAPGESYVKPKGEGFALGKIPGKTPTRVTAEITKVEETGY
jgi:tetratricopeptide (TPR) repeat protein